LSLGERGGFYFEKQGEFHQNQQELQVGFFFDKAHQKKLTVNPSF